LESPQRPRALRKPFVATIVITDVDSELQISTHTTDLSMHGCFVSTPTPLNLCLKVQITIVYAGSKVVASGRVETRTIVTGRTIEGETVVETDLKLGETIVPDGQTRLIPNAKVEIKCGSGEKVPADPPVKISFASEHHKGLLPTAQRMGP
jgi:hypothetical protein